MSLTENPVGVFRHLHSFLRERGRLNGNIECVRGLSRREQSMIATDLLLIATVDRYPPIILLHHHHPQSSRRYKVRIVELGDVAG